MKIYVDADACPVKQTIIEVAKDFHIEVVLVSSYAHYTSNAIKHSLVHQIMVDSSQESVDLYIVNHVQKGDLVITQDYGLAAMVLAKKGHALHHQGFAYTEQNMDELMFKRHLSAKIRRGGGKTKGPKAFTVEDQQRFKTLLTSSIQRLTH